ncbi:Ankyrin repeat-containing protein, partial [Brazilian cedratvirus IHUMI]
LHKTSWDERVFCEALYRKNLKMLQWARDRDCPWDKERCLRLAREKWPELVPWIEEQDD